MKRILFYLLFILACLNSCTTTREVRHQMTVHDTLRLNHHDTLRQWSIRHDSVFLHDSIYWQGNQMVKERLDSVQNLCVSSKVLIFVVEYKSNKNNGAYDATNIGIIFHISLLWRSF